MTPRSSAVSAASALLALATLSGGACRKGNDPGLIVASGHVEATEVLVSTKVAGTVESLAVDEGSIVAAGQELARIDTTDTRLALDAARAERAQADAELRLRLAGSRVEDVREARAQVDRAQADLAGARRDPDDPEMGWGPLIAGGIDVAALRCGHTAMLDEPNAPALAALLRARLQRPSGTARQA